MLSNWTYPEMFLAVMGIEYLVGSILYAMYRDWAMAGVLACYGVANFFLLWR